MKFVFPSLCLFVVIMSVFTGCSDAPDCEQELPSDSLNVVFYDNDSFEIARFKFERIIAVGANSVFYDSGDSLSSFSLQLNPSSDTVDYLFITGVTQDILSIKYVRKMDWLSEDCGPNMGYSGVKIISTTFDSVNVINGTIDELVNENIQIYF
ncbi:MAG: DUF6452 family protein [Reichenbachiella sp.]